MVCGNIVIVNNNKIKEIKYSRPLESHYFEEILEYLHSDAKVQV